MNDSIFVFLGEVVDEISTDESLQFDFSIIKTATDSFSDSRKLRQCSFRVVYMGQLSNGQEIAVKRLSQSSSQGEVEFKNEFMLLARLQHRNLVKLLGFCLKGVEQLLIYKFVPNSTLDQFIFDPLKRGDLNWDTRRKMIMGISDFGMARLFELDQTRAKTNRIYAMHGTFSIKSDVFSFGVLVLEIGVVWKNWKEGSLSNIIDPSITSGSSIEIVRCIHIGLLCVQENMISRPTMASVLLMLNSDSVTLQVPSRPAFYIHSGVESDMPSMQDYNLRVSKVEESRSKLNQFSENEASMTELYPR
ncbi:hypothetical protein EUGRSUZ_E03045 [Eucalyptus grandis]|uniref:Protein kinase domain-containing protein n=2 Tax=Eucalyptus grandis TaxID=71139 RepID=A0A059C8V8_EUCGR|nr:hypothetical protein EUGRSUZ_E03045 [Eucalyptus grandis]